MPSNKNKDLHNKVERTGKNEMVYNTACICPVLEKDKVVYQIITIGFTLSGECVTIEKVDQVDSEGAAIPKLQQHLVQSGALDIMNLRNIVKNLKEEKDAKKTVV